MKHGVWIGMLAFLATADALAFEGIAKVESVTPKREIVNEPYQSCGTELEQQTLTQTYPATASEDHSLAGSIVGGVAGGLIGSVFGEGNGKVAAAAAGAGIGAITGSQVGRSRTTPGYTTTTTTAPTPVQRCRMVDHYDMRTSYTVVYEYQGQRFTTTLPYDPGPEMKVNISVTPK